jgi:uncharacterized protein
MRLFWFVAIVLFALIPRFVVAQDTGPLIGSQATEQQALVAPALNDGVYRILVIGDSMAGGLGAGMARMAAGDAGYQIVSRLNESSALTRTDIYDWASAIPKIMDGKNFNAVVVLIGLNDRQEIRNGNIRYVFNTPDWIKSYQANTDAMLDALMAQNVKVFWLGEPPMGDPTYDADMKTVTALQKDRVIAKGASFIDTRPLLLGADGKYMDFGPDDTGEMKKLRQRDGVTFLKQGNNKFGQLILAAIKNPENLKQPDAAAPVAEAPAPGVAGPAPSSPVFGQNDANGVAVLHDAGDMIASAASSGPAAHADPALLNAPAAGTAAEKLFTTGEAGAAPLGRFDDYSEVEKPGN